MDTKTELSTNHNHATQEQDSLPQVFIDDVLVTLKYFIDEHDAHLKIASPEVCVHCESKGCLYFCPVGAYREQEDGHIQISYQSCIECGSCRVMCPHSNVQWHYPRGGYGVAYKFG